MSTGRLVIENIIKYGLLVRFDVLILFLRDPTAWPSALAFVCEYYHIQWFFRCSDSCVTKKYHLSLPNKIIHDLQMFLKLNPE
jgi:hypothetical protein